MTTELYKKILLDHARHPRNHGEVDHFQYTQRGRIPQCGDDITVGLNIANGRVTEIGFSGRACIISMASASLMTEAVVDATEEKVITLLDQVKAFFNSQDNEHELPEQLHCLIPVQAHRARRRCVLLAWEALQKVLAQKDAAENNSQ